MHVNAFSSLHELREAKFGEFSITGLNLASSIMDPLFIIQTVY